MNESLVHPRQALFDTDKGTTLVPVCDHYAGVEMRMRKSLELQAELVWCCTLCGT